ncbi:MAG: hypothetical protein ACQEP3_03165 [Patescibacteria group bacterium]
MSKKLRKYVKRELESGSSKEQVEKTLISAGWEEGEVKKALNQVADGEDVEEVEKVNLKSKGSNDNDKPKLILFVLVVLIMGLLLIGLFIAFTSFDPRMLFEL